MEFESDSSAAPTPKPAKPLVFRMPDTNSGIESMREVLLDRGWEEFQEGEQDEQDWNLWWRAARYRNCDYEDLMPWQRLNHFPKTTAVTKKDMLARNMRRMKGVYGASVYNFTPLAFNLPNDYTKFVAEYTRSKQQQKDDETGKEDFWICKPADSSRGRGIFIFQDLSQLTYDCSAVAQRYLTNPLLIAGYKFDLRLYVLVTSFHPLSIYMYQEGIVRFSTEKFDLSATGNLFSHLTNTSINKFSPNYGVDKERVGPGCKWSLTMLRNYFHQQNLDDEVLWQRICNIVTLTMLAQAPSVPKVSGSFELFGFDVIIDDNFKPWLLEVNFNPALGLDCVVDYTVKKAMLNDLIDVMTYKESDGERGGEQFQKLRAKHGFGKNKRTTTSNAKGVARIGPRKNNSVGNVGRMANSTFTRRQALSNRSGKPVLPLGRRVAGTTAKQAPLSKSSIRTGDESEDDYDEEIARVCGVTSSDTNLKSPTSLKRSSTDFSSNRQSKLSQREASQESLKRRNGSKISGTASRINREGINEVKSSNQGTKVNQLSENPQNEETVSSSKGSRLAIDSLSMPNVDEARKTLENRKELIRQRQEQKQPSNQNVGRGSSQARVHSNLSIKSSNYGLSPQGGLTVSKMKGTVSRPLNGVIKRPAVPGRPGQPVSTLSKKSSVNGKGRPWGGPTQTNKAQGDHKPTDKRSSNGSLSDLTSRPKQIGPLGAKQKTKVDPSVAGQSKVKGHLWPATNVGDFVLTFPFNDATKRASYPSLDIRTIIREAQKQLRRTICKAHSTKKVVRGSVRVGGRATAFQGEGSKNANNANETTFEEGLAIWAPLKSPSLNAAKA